MSYPYNVMHICHLLINFCTKQNHGIVYYKIVAYFIKLYFFQNAFIQIP